MSLYIRAVKKSEANEIKALMQCLKISYKKTENGYGPVKHDVYNYGLKEDYTQATELLFFEDENKEPDANTDSEATKDTTTENPKKKPPSGRYGSNSNGRSGRSRNTANRDGYVYASVFRPITTNLADKKSEVESYVQIESGSYGIRRVIHLSDLKDLKTFKDYIDSRIEIGSRYKKSDIHERNIVELWGFFVEGVDFNFTTDESKLPYKIIEFRGRRILEVFEKYYIVPTPKPLRLIQDYVKSRPVDVSKFLENIKTHFLANMNVSLAAKQKVLQELQRKLWQQTKEVSEIKFVFNSVQNSTNDHFQGIIDKIRTIPAFEKIDFMGSGFTVTTKDLWAEIENTRVYIGAFEIRLSITDRFVVEYRNTSSPCTGGWDKHHPHGDCTGGHYGVIQQALSSLDYYTFILSVVELLQTVNPREKSLQGLIDQGWTEQKPPRSKLKNLVDWRNLLDQDANIDDRQARENTVGGDDDLLSEDDIEDDDVDPSDDDEDDN